MYLNALNPRQLSSEILVALKRELLTTNLRFGFVWNRMEVHKEVQRETSRKIESNESSSGKSLCAGSPDTLDAAGTQSGRPVDALRHDTVERSGQRGEFKRGQLKTWIKSSTVVALAFFAIINGCLALPASMHGAVTKNVDQNGVWQTVESAVEQYKVLSQPDIVLLGSSLIMSPVWTADFHQFTGVSDFYRHHRSFLLEQKLAAASGTDVQTAGTKGGAGAAMRGGISSAAPVISPKQSDAHQGSVFSFAVPGAMVSDMDLILSKVLVGPRKPNLIVYGVAPRDFMDDLAGSETKTVVFQRLGDVGDLSKSNFADTSVDEKLELVFNKVVYLFGKRTRYQSKTDSFFRRVAQRIAHDPSEQLMAAANANICPLFQDRKILWQKSLDEYRMRYQRFNQLQYKKQQGFLQDLLSTCRKNGIAIVLVNMPLTRANQELMPPGLYENYLSMLNECAKKNGVTFVDLHDGRYQDLWFYDTVHLNGEGAQVFLASISQAICHERERITQSLASKQRNFY